MELEYQVNTKEQGQKFEKLFQELENPPQSYFVWAKTKKGEWIPVEREFAEEQHAQVISAFSCAELGVLLPEYIYRNDKSTQAFYCVQDRQNNAFKFAYMTPYNEYKKSQILISGYIFDHEAHAKADLVPKLLDQKFIKAEGLKL